MMDYIFSVERTSQYGNKKTQRTFVTIEQFMEWVKEQKDPVIVSWDKDDGWCLEIYDDYRE